MESATTFRSEPLPILAPEAPLAPTLGMFDLVLRGQEQLTQVLRDERALPVATQRLLVLSLLGLGVHGLVVGFAAQVLDRGGDGWIMQQGHPMAWMPIAFILAFLGALAVCLPSFYFYTQLSGLDASFRLVAAQALRAQATTSVLLLGAIPFYAAAVLSAAVGLVGNVPAIILIGLCLPFVVGLIGLRALYRAFSDLAKVLPITHARRGNFLARMVLCWGAIYTAVAPVALYRLAEALGQRI
jgi:hypothetical protein